MPAVHADRLPAYSPHSQGGPSNNTALEFVGHAPAHLAALQQAQRFARYEHASVLIEGESGTGKSYVARLVHERSPRASGIFHQVILSALDDALASSDLFGHKVGAYTDARQQRSGHFVSASGGTLFLDEIGKTTLAVQRKLLHAIEHKEIWPVGSDRAIPLDVRLVVASNLPIDGLVARGAFLDDLAARITIFRICLPALRERRDDIPALVQQFVRRRARSCGYPLREPRFDLALVDLLQRADWPGNLRQLDGVVQRVLIEADGAEVVTPAHCTEGILEVLPALPTRDRVVTPTLVAERMGALGSVTAVGQELGISRWTVYRYLEKANDGRLGLV